MPASTASDSNGGMMIRSDRVERCGNAGFRIMARRDEGRDGSIVTGNIVGKIDWVGGGNGQNGNGVNVYQADSVIVCRQRLHRLLLHRACASTAGATTQVRGNTC